MFGETRAATAAGICFSYPLAVQSIQSHLQAAAALPRPNSGRHNQVQTAAAPIPTFMFMPHCHGGEPCSCLCSSLTGQSRSCGVSVYACGYEVSITAGRSCVTPTAPHPPPLPILQPPLSLSPDKLRWFLLGSSAKSLQEVWGTCQSVLDSQYGTLARSMVPLSV